MVGLAVEVRVDRRAHVGAIVLVDAPDPLAQRVGDLAGEVADDLLAARRADEAPGGDVPVPDAVVGAADGQRVALLALRHPPARLVGGARVADRALEQAGVQLVRDQVVGDARRRGGDVRGPVRVGRDQDDGSVRGDDAGGREVAVEEDDVVGLGGVVVDDVVGALHRAQQRPHAREVPLVVGQQQDVQGRAHAAGGSATVSSHQLESDFIVSTRSRKVTGSAT
jgi:hypothetical protein